MGRRLTRDRTMTLGFFALSLALAFWQRPGWAATDTKIDLHVDPGRFLSFVASVWTPTGDLGEVHSSQYTGYLWPMGPFYALEHALGISPWVAQRIWMGLIYFLAAWGMLRLVDRFVSPRRGIVHLVAATFFLFNPYTVVFTGRTTITLLGYAALPWLLVIVHQGVRSVGRWRDWRGWWSAAAFALVLTSIGGGINAAVIGWMLVGPLVLLIYEPAVGAVRWRDSGGLLLRMGILGILASLWWILPLLVHVSYGIDFLKFTEQPRSIWNTNSITESMRLMSYWTSYINFGFFGAQRALYPDSPTMLFNPLVVGASLLLPALAVLAFGWVRRWRYAPFLMLMTIVGVIIMAAGFPFGTPLRSVMESAYHATFIVRFMRTTQKAAPLVAVGVAVLLGLGAQVGWRRLRGWRPARPPLRRLLLAAAPAALLALIVLASLPLVRGTALDAQMGWKRIPAAWRQSGQDLDHTLPQNTRAVILPGQIFAFYNWGGTGDAILPRLTHRPVAVRYETPYSDLHAVDLLTTVDNLVQQRRLVPGELLPLLRLMGTGAVISGADDDITRTGALDPAAAADALAGQGLTRPSHSYGPVRAHPVARSDVGAPVPLPEVRRYDVGGSRGLVHLDPVTQPTVIDGDAAGVANLAAFGALPSRSSLMLAGDESSAAIARQAAAGADIVVTDSNRRREYIPEYTQQDVGPTIGAADTFDVNSAQLNPLLNQGPDGQTVSTLRGASSLRSPTYGGTLSFPENAPIAAFDGDPSTAWVADRYLGPDQRYIDVGLPAPRDISYVDVMPLSGSHGTVTDVDVNGVHAHVGLGWTRIRINLHRVRDVRIRIDNVRQPRHGLGGPGGFSEIRIPGVHIRQLLRTPVLTAKALAGRDVSHSSLSYVFERVTGDDPFHRDRYRVSPVLEELAGRGDQEQLISRATFVPAPRRFSLDSWVTAAVAASDSAFDRLVGMDGAYRFDSSSRFHDRPEFRASSAFDGRSGTAWVADWLPGEAPNPWISVSAPRPLSVARLTLTHAALHVAFPTRVAVSWPGGATGPLAVASDGSVVLPRAVRARSFRLTVLGASWSAVATPRDRTATAVGIGEVTVPGLPAARVPRTGALRPFCGVVRVRAGSQVIPLGLTGTVAALDAGTPLQARQCGAPVVLGAGIQTVQALPGAFSVDLLRLRSPAPDPVARAAVGPGQVLTSGHLNQSSLTGVRLNGLTRPAWLVLGESYDAGWQATCDGRALGAPRPIDGYANGWLAPAGCQLVAFHFGPQSEAIAGYVGSAIVCTILGLFLLGGWVVLRRRGRATVEEGPVLPEPRVRALPLPRALAVSAAAAVLIGVMFALRAGVGAFPVIGFVLWRGLRPRTLTLVAAGLLGIAVPLAYLIVDVPNLGGYNFSYSVSLISAHWLGLAAIILLLIASLHMVVAARREGRAHSTETPERRALV